MSITKKRIKSIKTASGMKASKQPKYFEAVAELCDFTLKAIEALEMYGAGRHIWAESEARPGNVCKPIGFYANEVLNLLEDE